MRVYLIKLVILSYFGGVGAIAGITKARGTVPIDIVFVLCIVTVCNAVCALYLFKRGVVYYILELDDVPIGCAALEKADPDHCYLERLAVTPLYRNNGFGKALVDHVLAQARAFEMKSIGI